MTGGAVCRERGVLLAGWTAMRPQILEPGAAIAPIVRLGLVR